LEAKGLGHIPMIIEILNKLKGLRDTRIAIVISPQTIYGRVHPYVYSPLRKLSIELKCIFAEDMLPEVAYIKLGWVLGHTTKLEEIKKMMLTNYAGEITERSDEKSFLY